jgi:hypothetical protein
MLGWFMRMVGWLKTMLEVEEVCRDSHRARLNLEQLGTLVMPANNIWTNATGNRDFNNVANWSLNAVPAQADTIWFKGNQGANANQGTTFPTMANKIYSGIVLENGFTGTVVFPADVTFHGYVQSCGKTEHEGAPRTITVTHTFTWTGGSIDYSINGYEGIGGGATYDLKGVPNGQIGTDTTTLNTGAYFILERSDTLITNVVQAGTLHMLADVTGIEVRIGCMLDQRRINPQAPGVLPVITVDPTNLTDFLGDRGVTLTGGGMYKSAGGTVPTLQIDGGTFDVSKGGVTVTGRLLNGFGVYMANLSSTTYLLNGESLSATNGFCMNDGLFVTKYAVDGVQLPKIVGTFTMTGGSISLGVGAPQNVVGYTTLTITWEVLHQTRHHEQPEPRLHQN